MGITKKQWERLRESEFESATVLEAVDAVDKVRGHLGDQDDGRPPQLREDLMRLHQIAMDVFSQGSKAHVDELFDLADEIESAVNEVLEHLEIVRSKMEELTALNPATAEFRSERGIEDEE